MLEKPKDNDTQNIYQEIKRKVYQTMPQEFADDQPELIVPEPDSDPAPEEDPVSTESEDQTDDLDMLMAMAEALNDD